MNEHKKSGKLLKRLLVVCLCLVMALGSAVTIIAASFDGDLNGDGKVTALDAQMLAEYEAGLRDLDLSDKIGLTVKSIIDWILGRTASEPNLDEGIEAVVEVKTENGEVTKEVSFTDGILSVTVREGTKVTSETLTVTVKKLTSSESDVALEEGQELLPLDIHVEGVAADNTTPIIIGVAGALDAAMNEGNLELYHVENGVAQPMNQVESAEALSAHNDFYYDPANGDITVSMATFSEVAMVSDTDKAWKGNYDYSWYTAHNEALAKRSGNDADYIIANADQLAAFGAIVGGMAEGFEQDSFADKTVVLAADINLGDKESENNPNIIFYPIGYNSDDGKYEKTGVAVSTGFYTFQGEFDGQGHTIANFYQNTWEMKGDNNYYDATLQYYRDGMGLFGKVYGGTVKNLTVENFSSDGEYTTTGVIAAYADGATFENIAITNCNPRVYNIGNGGIVGCVGWYATEANLTTTFTNITVDNSNKISALWGSWDVACGGIVGQYYPTSGQSSASYPVNAGIDFKNCHVAAQMDVYNDVCANYQYYAYRYTGMMIGSIRENLPADANGYVYPKMDGITASGCTVHFGDWNDYYYCEIIDNTTASYTHDYQMSRLTEIKAIDGTTITYLDGTTGTVPASGRANYVIVDYTKGHGTENATCYHFKDGEVWTHEMGGYEEKDINGDGIVDSDILKEDKQHIYLEFDQLFTGYGWGVTSKGLTDYEGVENMDITHSDNEASVEKFESVAVGSYTTGATVTIGELFTSVDNGIEVDADNVQVFVSPVGEDSTAGGTYVAADIENGKNWTDGTLTFSGTGAATITITDYYFCTPTTIEVEITKRTKEKKFELVFPNTTKYLYRVGNQNTVTLSSLFEAAEGAEIGTVTVNIENVAGNVSGTYNSNATWTNGTIQFVGTGVVKVTITDNDYCTPTELNLQVVDATNVTNATSATANNVVLLNDCGFSSLEVSGGYTLYGNGFTLTCETDSYAADLGYSFVTLNSGILDNVQIVCPNFDYAALYMSNLTSSDNRSYTDNSGKVRYYNARSGVMVSGNSQILNSRISGARAAVNISGGNCVIENSRIELGAVASILVGAANSVTLRDVALVQKPTASTYDPSKLLMGFSVLFVCDANGDAAPVTLEGTLIQNAWVDESDKQYVPSAGESIISTVLGKTDYLHDLDEDGTKESLNLGFAYMPESLTSAVNTTTITDNRTNKDVVPYDYAEVAILSGKTYVYSYKNTNGTNADYKSEADYVPNKNSDIIEVAYSDTADGLTTGKSFGTAGWTYELNVDLDKLSGYALDFSKLTMSVNGIVQESYTVTDASGNAVDTTSPITVVAGGTTYTLTVTIDGVTYTATYKVTGTETSKESPSLVAADYEAGLCVASSKGGTWHGAAPVLEGIQIKYWSVAEKQYKTITLSDYTPTTPGKQNDTNNYWTYSPDNGDFTLTITNTAYVQSSKQVYAMPVCVDDSGSYTLYFVAANSNGLVNTGNSARTIAISYSFKDNNNGDELTFSHTWSVEEDEDNEYSYSDLCSGTLTKLEDSGGCVTGDTLITLADGSQVRVDALTGSEELLVWNLETGSYDTAPIVFVDSEEEAEYEVVNLHFSDGSKVGVVYEHGFFDLDLGKYVYLDAENAESYIGHTFVTQGDIKAGTWNTATLTDVVIEKEVTKVYSPVTFSHLCYYTDGVLSMPGGIEGLFNIFDVDTSVMAYDAEKKAADIETYGLFTLEDFGGMITEEAFYAFNGAYLKVAMAKGLLTWEDIAYMAERYIPLM